MSIIGFVKIGHYHTLGLIHMLLVLRLARYAYLCRCNLNQHKIFTRLCKYYWCVQMIGNASKQDCGPLGVLTFLSLDLVCTAIFSFRFHIFNHGFLRSQVRFKQLTLIIWIKNISLLNDRPQCLLEGVSSAEEPGPPVLPSAYPYVGLRSRSEAVWLGTSRFLVSAGAQAQSHFDVRLCLLNYTSTEYSPLGVTG